MYTHLAIQSNFNGSNKFETIEICSRQEYFELKSVNHSARSEGIMGISFRSYLNKMYIVCTP